MKIPLRKSYLFNHRSFYHNVFKSFDSIIIILLVDIIISILILLKYNGNAILLIDIRIETIYLYKVSTGYPVYLRTIFQLYSSTKLKYYYNEPINLYEDPRPDIRYIANNLSILFFDKIKKYYFNRAINFFMTSTGYPVCRRMIKYNPNGKSRLILEKKIMRKKMF